MIGFRRIRHNLVLKLKNQPNPEPKMFQLNAFVIENDWIWGDPPESGSGSAESGIHPDQGWKTTRFGRLWTMIDPFS